VNDPLKYLESKITRDSSGCWLWHGVILSTGYGQAASNGRRFMAHRFAYELLVGPIPAGLTIDHLCRVRQCVNPDHMEPVSRWENVRRAPTNPVAANLTKTTCPRGHEYTSTGRKGWRKCRTCVNELSRQKRRERGAQIAAALRTHCPRGHAYDEANTRITTKGGRSCRTCDRARTRAWRQRRNAA